MTDILHRARELRAKIVSMAAPESDDDAYEFPELYDYWKSGVDYIEGDKRRDPEDGLLYKCKQAHTSQSDWAPRLAVSLWVRVLPGQDGTLPGPWEQPTANNGYKYKDKVTHIGHIWQSNFDPEGVLGGNIWEPGAVGVYTWDDLGEIPA